MAKTVKHIKIGILFLIFLILLGGCATKSEAGQWVSGIMLNHIKTGKKIGTVNGEWFKKNYKVLNNKVVIVDVRDKIHHDAGSLLGSINVDVSKYSPKEFFARLPKNKTIVFHCSGGHFSKIAWNKAKLSGADMNKIFYFNARIFCFNHTCRIIPKK